MKIACVQMNISFGEPEKNFAAVEKYIKEAATANVDVIIFPEMWNTGYALNQLDSLADENGEETKQLFAEACKRIQCEHCGRFRSNEKR